MTETKKPVVKKPTAPKKEVVALGLTNINEVFDLLDVLATLASKIMKDGKLGMSDLPHAMEALKEYNKAILAINDIGKAIDELKDIDQAEAIVIVARVFKIVNSIKAILLPEAK